MEATTRRCSAVFGDAAMSSLPKDASSRRSRSSTSEYLRTVRVLSSCFDPTVARLMEKSKAVQGKRVSARKRSALTGNAGVGVLNLQVHRGLRDASGMHAVSITALTRSARLARSGWRRF